MYWLSGSSLAIDVYMNLPQCESTGIVPCGLWIFLTSDLCTISVPHAREPCAASRAYQFSLAWALAAEAG